MYGKDTTSAPANSNKLSPANPFDITYNVMEDASVLSARVVALADRLFGPGPTPTPATVTGDAAQPPGVFGALECRALSTGSLVHSAYEALSRIEAALP